MHKTQVFLVQQMALDLKIPQRCHLSRLVKAPVSYGHISEIGLGSIICHWGLTWLHLDLRPPGGASTWKIGLDGTRACPRILGNVVEPHLWTFDVI